MAKEEDHLVDIPVVVSSDLDFSSSLNRPMTAIQSGFLIKTETARVALQKGPKAHFTFNSSTLIVHLGVSTIGEDFS